VTLPDDQSGQPADADRSSEAPQEGRFLPVPAGGPVIEGDPPRPLATWSPAALPATVVAASGGFLAGVAAYVMTRVMRRRRAQRALGRALSPRGGRKGGLDIAGSRSFLVDIHLLRR
jgi:hypothetical protein